MKKKFTFLIAALFALMLITLPGMVKGQTRSTTELLNEDFSSITTTLTNQEWDGNDNFPKSGNSKVYPNTGKIKLGSSSAVGYVTSKSLAVSTGTLTVAFDVLGWNDGAGSISITVGSTTETVSYSASNSFVSKSQNFTIENAGNITVKIGTTSSYKRGYLDNIVITNTTSGGGSTTYTLSSAVTPADAGSVALSATSLEQGATATATYTANTHYSFTSWSISGTGASLSSTSDNPTTVTMGTANATVTANFNEDPKYNITYNANYEGSTDEPVVVSEYAGESVTIAPYSTFTRAGYAITSWNTAAGGGGTSYSAGDSYTMTSADLTLYAQWEESNEVVDELTVSWTGVTSTTYSTWSDKSVENGSGAVYAGKTSKLNNGIGLRTDGSDCGIITTTSGGNVRKVVVTWTSTSARTLQVYGKNTAYTEVSELFNSSNQGELLGTIVYGTSTELTISGDYAYVGLRSASSALSLEPIKITWEHDNDPAVPTSITINDENINNDCGNSNTNGGTLSATVYDDQNNAISGASVTWTSSNTSVATIDATSGAVTLSSVGTTTITASYAGAANEYKPSEQTYTLNVIDSYASGGLHNPYTVAEARTAIDAGTGVTGVYVTGTVCTASNNLYSGGKLSYWISDDGTTTNRLEAYNGLSFNGESFTSVDDVQVGDIVVIYGNLTKYNSTYEFAADNQLVSLVRKTITVTPNTIDAAAAGTSGSLTIATENMTISDLEEFDVQFYDSNNEEITNPGWVTFGAFSGSGNAFSVGYTVSSTTVARTAYFKVYTITDEVFSNLVTVTQAAYVAPENKYIRFSGELVEGDYLIVYNGGAMNNTVTSDRLQYEEVTAINNVIATDDNTIIWHIAKSGNYWTIKNKNDNKYAASNGKNKAQMLDAGTADEALWTITGTTTYDFENKARAAGSDSGNKWLRKNGTYGFACYASGTGGALSLYIKNCVLPVTNDVLTATAEIPEGNITVYDDLTIPSGENFVLTVSGTLEVQGTLTNTEASHLIVKEGGQLIISSGAKDDVKATFQRKVVGYGSSTDKDKYILLANPTTDDGGINPTSVGMLTNDYDLYYFDESKNGAEWRNYKKETFNLVNGTGYLYANSVTKTLEFAGTVPTGTSANITLSKTDDNTYAGFNLVGNPMSVNITSMNIGGSACSYYKLDSETGVFAVSTDPIIVGEAFMVEAPTNEATLSLNPGAKGENGFNNDVIRLEVSNSKYTDVAFLYFGNHLPLTKINHLNDEAPMLYIHNEKVDQAVAVMNDRSEVKSVNVNFEAKVMGSYTISGKAEKGNFSYMHLYDRLTGADTDLLISDYTFIGSTTDATGRFILRFEAIDNNSESESFAYQNGSDIIVNGEGELQIFDVMGRMVSTQHINGVERVNVKSQGVYIFRLNERTQKIVVR